VKVGDLPTPCCDCTCAFTGRAILVTGGYDGAHGLSKSDIAPINIQ
jgi:hypothetical protein